MSLSSPQMTSTICEVLADPSFSLKSIPSNAGVCIASRYPGVQQLDAVFSYLLQLGWTNSHAMVAVTLFLCSCRSLVRLVRKYKLLTSIFEYKNISEVQKLHIQLHLSAMLLAIGIIVNFILYILNINPLWKIFAAGIDSIELITHGILTAISVRLCLYHYKYTCVNVHSLLWYGCALPALVQFILSWIQSTQNRYDSYALEKSLQAFMVIVHLIRILLSCVTVGISGYRFVFRVEREKSYIDTSIDSWVFKVSIHFALLALIRSLMTISLTLDLLCSNQNSFWIRFPEWYYFAMMSLLSAYFACQPSSPQILGKVMEYTENTESPSMQQRHITSINNMPYETYKPKTHYFARQILQGIGIFLALSVVVCSLLHIYLVSDTPETGVPILNLILACCTLFVHLTLGIYQNGLRTRTFVSIRRWILFSLLVIFGISIPFMVLPKLSFYLGIGTWPVTVFLIVITVKIRKVDTVRPFLYRGVSADGLRKVYNTARTPSSSGRSGRYQPIVTHNPTFEEFFSVEWIESFWTTSQIMAMIWIYSCFLVNIVYGYILPMALAISFVCLIISLRVTAPSDSSIVRQMAVYGAGFLFLSCLVMAFMVMPVVLSSKGVGGLVWRPPEDTWNSLMRSYPDVHSNANLTGIFVPKNVLRNSTFNYMNASAFFTKASSSSKTIIVETESPIQRTIPFLNAICQNNSNISVVFLATDGAVPWDLYINNLSSSPGFKVPTSISVPLDLPSSIIQSISFKQLFVEPYVVPALRSRNTRVIVNFEPGENYSQHAFNLINRLGADILVTSDINTANTNLNLVPGSSLFWNALTDSWSPILTSATSTLSDTAKWLIATFIIPVLFIFVLSVLWVVERFFLVPTDESRPRSIKLTFDLQKWIQIDGTSQLATTVLFLQFCGLLSWLVSSAGVIQALSGASSPNRLPYGPTVFAYIFTALGSVSCILSSCTLRSLDRRLVTCKTVLEVIVLVSVGYLGHSSVTDSFKGAFILIAIGCGAFIATKVISFSLIGKERSPTTFDTDYAILWLSGLSAVAWLLCVIGIGRVSVELGVSINGVAHYMFAAIGLVGPLLLFITTCMYGPWLNFTSVFAITLSLASSGGTLGHSIYMMDLCSTTGSIMSCSYQFKLILVGSILYTIFGTLLLIYKICVDLKLLELNQISETVKEQIRSREESDGSQQSEIVEGVKDVPLPALPQKPYIFIHLTQAESQWSHYRAILAVVALSWGMLTAGVGLVPGGQSDGLVAAAILSVLLYPASYAFTLYGILGDTRQVVAIGCLIGICAMASSGRTIASLFFVPHSSGITLFGSGILLLFLFGYTHFMTTKQFRFPQANETLRIAGVHRVYLIISIIAIGWIFLTAGIASGISESEMARTGISWAWYILADAMSIVLIFLMVVDVASHEESSSTAQFKTTLKWKLNLRLLADLCTTSSVGVIGAVWFGSVSAISNCGGASCNSLPSLALFLLGSSLILIAICIYKFVLIMYGSLIDLDESSLPPSTTKDSVDTSSESENETRFNTAEEKDHAAEVYKIFLIWPLFQEFMKISLISSLIFFLVFLVSYLAEPSSKPPYVVYCASGTLGYYFLLKWLRFGSFSFYCACIVSLLIANGSGYSSMFLSASAAVPSFHTGIILGSVLHLIVIGLIISATMAWRSNENSFLHSFVSVSIILASSFAWLIFIVGTIIVGATQTMASLDGATKTAFIGFSVVGSVYFGCYLYQYYYALSPMSRFFAYLLLFVSHGLSASCLVLSSQKWALEGAGRGYQFQTIGSGVYFLTIFAFIVVKIHVMTKVELHDAQKARLLEEDPDHDELLDATFQKHWLFSRPYQTTRGLIHFLIVIGWLSTLIVIVAIYLSGSRFGLLITTEIHGIFVALTSSLVAYHLFVNYLWMSAGSVFVIGSLFTLTFCGPVITSLIPFGGILSLLHISGASSAIFILLFVGLYLVHRPKRNVPNSWTKGIRYILPLIILGWGISVIGIAAGVEKFTFIAPVFIQFLQISFPGGISWLVMGYIHVWPLYGETVLRLMKTWVEPYIRTFKARDRRRKRKEKSEEEKLKEKNADAGIAEFLLEPKDQPIGEVQKKEQSMDSKKESAVDKTEPVSPPEEDLSAAKKDESKIEVDDTETERPEYVMTLHPLVVALSALALLLSATTSLSGFSVANAPTVISLVGSIFSCMGHFAYIVMVALDERLHLQELDADLKMPAKGSMLKTDSEERNLETLKSDGVSSRGVSEQPHRPQLSTLLKGLEMNESPFTSIDMIPQRNEIGMNESIDNFRDDELEPFPSSPWTKKTQVTSTESIENDSYTTPLKDPSLMSEDHSNLELNKASSKSPQFYSQSTPNEKQSVVSSAPPPENRPIKVNLPPLRRIQRLAQEESEVTSIFSPTTTQAAVDSLAALQQKAQGTYKPLNSEDDVPFTPKTFQGAISAISMLQSKAKSSASLLEQVDLDEEKWFDKDSSDPDKIT